jgi:hypothetical protein
MTCSLKNVEGKQYKYGGDDGFSILPLLLQITHMMMPHSRLDYFFFTFFRKLVVLGFRAGKMKNVRILGRAGSVLFFSDTNRTATEGLPLVDQSCTKLRDQKQRGQLFNIIPLKSI